MRRSEGVRRSEGGVRGRGDGTRSARERDGDSGGDCSESESLSLSHLSRLSSLSLSLSGDCDKSVWEVGCVCGILGESGEWERAG
jgi:hypothetical protein